MTMGKRHEAVGVKQVLRYEWLQRTVNLLLAGLDAKAIRLELHAFLAEKRGSGEEKERSEGTRTFAVNNLMKIWVSPEAELLPFRDASLSLLREHPAFEKILHWGMISAVYPFWFNTARQTGRLLALQERVTQAQIIKRMKEQYGDRQTISRYTRFVVRSFVAWGVLVDSKESACYERAEAVKIDDLAPALLLLESALHATPEERLPLTTLVKSPAFFPFRLPPLGGERIAQNTERLCCERYNVHDVFVRLQDGGMEKTVKL
jgi:hypothetical protein